jgi:hypothetical protein
MGIASFNEKLLLSIGLNVSPLKNSESKARSLREVVHSIDNEKDLSNYLSSFANKVGRQNMEIKYERHPVSVINFMSSHILIIGIGIEPFGSNCTPSTAAS